MKTFKIFSTLSASTVYTPALIPSVENFKFTPETSRILINGGANVAAKTIRGGLHTPTVVTTEINENQLDALRVNQHFLKHEKGGFIRVEESKVKLTAEKAAASLQSGDKSKPLTPKTLPKGIQEAEDPNAKNK